MTARTADVVVIGGGIVGSSAAAFLSEAGARVVLVEREGLAAGASGANSGVVQQPFDRALVPLYQITLQLYRTLADSGVGFRMEPTPAGMLFVSGREEAARLQAASIAEAFPGLETEVLGGEDLRKVEPAVGHDLWACRVGIGYPVTPAASTYAYASLAQARGATVRLGRSAEIALSGESVSGVRVGDDLVTTQTVLVAAGPWTPGLLDPTGRWLPITRRWGVVVEAELAGPPRHALEEAGIDAVIGPAGAPSGVDDHGAGATDEGAGGDTQPPEPTDGVEFSLVPQPGASSVGSTFLDAEPDPNAWIEPILVRACRYVPAVADAPIRGVRVCARPQSADGRPLIGPVPGRTGLYVCAGHGPWGISTGPGSARLVADLILGLNAAIPAEFDPLRFGLPGCA